jgi:hypothetical protein
MSKSSHPLIHNEPVRYVLFNETDVPSGGWRYTDPDLGITITHINLGQVFQGATQLRVANKRGLPRMWPMVFRSLVCEQMGLDDRFCKPFVNPHTETKEKDPKRRVTFGDVRNFLAVLREWMQTRADFVSPDEAERRASICAGCPHNIPATGCAGCTNIVALVTSVIGGRKTSKDDQLENCGICGCANRAQIHIPLEVLAEGVTSDMEFPDYCWKKSTVMLTGI